VPPQLASLLVAVGVLGLFRLNRDPEARTSPALWLPIGWLALGSSRTVTQWLGAAPMASSPDQYIEGSPLDRAIFSALIMLSVLVLINRWQRTRNVLSQNTPLLLFFLFCAASAAWSDFPFVTLKRWTKAFGNFTMVLVVLTEVDAVSAVKRLLTRTAFILIPSSILLIYYYPEFGRYSHPFTKVVYNSGVALNKNLLAGTCMVLGLGVLWQFLDAFRQTSHRTGRLVALGTVFGMDLWLLYLSGSVTASVCFLIGGAVIASLSLSRQPLPRMVHLMVGGIAVLAIVGYVLIVTLPERSGFLLKSVGRTATLSGRTGLWQDLLQMSTNPWVGAGFESFFLGDRLNYLWAKYWWHPNQAHSGYVETYLTLGLVGLGLLALLMITGYRNVIRHYREDPGTGSLLLAYLVIAPIYTITEAAFKVMHPLWIVFLLTVTAAPAVRRQKGGRTHLPPAVGPKRAERLNWGPAYMLTWLQNHRRRKNIPVVLE
jgi:exopolysaccharide production protein ExoQ